MEKIIKYTFKTTEMYTMQQKYRLNLIKQICKNLSFKRCVGFLITQRVEIVDLPEPLFL